MVITLLWCDIGSFIVIKYHKHMNTIIWFSSENQLNNNEQLMGLK